MAKIIVVTSGKGGVGKTTTSASFATGLAQRGHKTAVIDFDVGLRNLDLIMGVERRVVFDFVNVINHELPPDLFVGSAERQFLIHGQTEANGSTLDSEESRELLALIQRREAEATKEVTFCIGVGHIQDWMKRLNAHSRSFLTVAHATGPVSNEE